jgi:hypothetical protein
MMARSCSGGFGAGRVVVVVAVVVAVAVARMRRCGGAAASVREESVIETR